MSCTYMNKKTLVIGASLNTEKYSNIAIRLLQKKSHEALAVGVKPGHILETHVETEMIDHKEIHTVSLYLSPKHQPAYYQYVISLNPQRVIFNPGTENQGFEELLRENNIFYESACTLVLLNTDQY